MNSLPLYLTPPHPCPYLAERDARELVALAEDGALAHFSALARLGFRRSGAQAYRPQCPSCSACQALRVDVDRFAPTRSQRRTLARNADLTPVWRTGAPATDHRPLFESYLQGRHPGGEMAADAETTYRELLSPPGLDGGVLELRDAGGLLYGALIADRLSDGLSAVYSYFDAAQRHRGLGTALVLALIGEARKRHLPWVYLGYWIEDCAKMRYKRAYRPHQLWDGSRWG